MFRRYGRSLVGCLSLVLAVFVLSGLLNGCSGSKPVAIQLAAAKTTVDPTDSTTVTATVMHDKNSAGVSWSVTGAGTLSNSSTSSVTYTAPASVPAAATATITATSNADKTISATITIQVPVAPSISTTSLTPATVGAVYSASLSATGGISPYTWMLASGTLPPGFTLSSSGVLSGPAVNAGMAGSYSGLVFQVTDSGSPTALTATTSPLTLVIAPAPTITFTTAATLPAVTVGTAYSASVAATGGAGALTYSLASGALPTGFTLSAAGAITGTPNSADIGTAHFVIQAADAFGDRTTQSFSLSVNAAPAISFTTASTLPGATVGTAYSASVAATGGAGALTYSIASGALPAGFTLATSGGITGTPTAASVGTATFTVKAADSFGDSASQSFTVVVSYPKLTVTTTSLPGGLVNTPYSSSLGASGGSGSGYSWQVLTGALPVGVTLSTSGSLSGTPTATGTSSFTVQVTDSVHNTATQALSIQIATLAITTTSLPNATVGSPYSTTLAEMGGTGPFNWTITAGSSAPGGLALASNGVLSGTPTTASGSTPTAFSVTVTDANSNSATAVVSLQIYPGTPLVIQTTTLSSATVGTAYSEAINVNGGVPPYTYSIPNGSLPAWATLSNGKITGTPASTDTGSSTFTVKVTDSASQSVTQSYTLTVYAISGANNALLKGQYAFLVKGWIDGVDMGSTTKQAIVGSFVADGNGNITSGTADMNNITTQTGASPLSISGTYALPSNNIGQMTLTVGSKTVTLAFTVGTLQSSVATAGSIVEFDDVSGVGATPGGSRFTGEFALQTPSSFTAANLTGGYAFGLEGETCPVYLFPGAPAVNSNCSQTLTEGPVAIAGTMSFSGAGAISNGMEDIDLNDGNCPNSNGTPTCTYNYPQATFTGSYGTPNTTNGRTTLTLNAPAALPAGTLAIWPTHYVAYMVSASKIYWISTDPHIQDTLLAGSAIQNTVTTFSNANMNGNEVLYEVSAQDDNGWGTSGYGPQSDVTLVLANVNGSAGTISATLQQNAAGTFTTKSATGTYSVAANGRVTMTVGNQPPVMYLAGTGIGYGVESSGQAGLFHLEQQTATTLSSATFAGETRMSVAPSSLSTSQVTSNSGNVNILRSSSNSNGTLNWDATNSDTYTVDPTGLITLSNGAVGYVISPTRFVIMDKPTSSNTAPTATVLQQ